MGSPVKYEIEAPDSSKYQIEPASPNAGLAPAAGAPLPKGTLPNGGDTGEGPIAQGMTTFENKLADTPKAIGSGILAKHWPVIDAHNMQELGQDVKSLNPIDTDEGSIPMDIGGTAANLLPFAKGISEIPFAKAAETAPRIGRAALEGGKAAVEHTPFIGKPITKGIQAATKSFRESAPAGDAGAPLPQNPAIAAEARRNFRTLSSRQPGENIQEFRDPGAHLPEHPGTFPGAHLPAPPPPEVIQARALAEGGKAVNEPPAALGRIPSSGTISRPSPWSSTSGLDIPPNAAAEGKPVSPSMRIASSSRGSVSHETLPDTIKGAIANPKGRLVMTPGEAQAADQMSKIAKVRASENGMKYAAGMRPANGKVPARPNITEEEEWSGVRK